MAQRKYGAVALTGAQRVYWHRRRKRRDTILANYNALVEMLSRHTVDRFEASGILPGPFLAELTDQRRRDCEDWEVATGERRTFLSRHERYGLQAMRHDTLAARREAEQLGEVIGWLPTDRSGEHWFTRLNDQLQAEHEWAQQLEGTGRLADMPTDPSSGASEGYSGPPLRPPVVGKIASPGFFARGVLRGGKIAPGLGSSYYLDVAELWRLSKGLGRHRPTREIKLRDGKVVVLPIAWATSPARSIPITPVLASLYLASLALELGRWLRRVSRDWTDKSWDAVIIDGPGHNRAYWKLPVGARVVEADHSRFLSPRDAVFSVERLDERDVAEARLRKARAEDTAIRRWMAQRWLRVPRVMAELGWPQEIIRAARRRIPPWKGLGASYRSPYPRWAATSPPPTQFRPAYPELEHRAYVLSEGRRHVRLFAWEVRLIFAVLLAHIEASFGLAALQAWNELKTSN